MTTHCLACGSLNIENILDFGPQPAANLLATSLNSVVKREDLALNYCIDCGHAQQRSFYSPNELFENYLYQSGTSNTLKDYFSWLSTSISKAFPPKSRVLEIASNDGSCLTALASAGLYCEGVEPAKNIAEISQNSGHRVHVGFWPMSIDEKFDVVLAQNVAAHTPDPLTFMRGVYDALSNDGVAYIQSSQADMFENFEFDTLYHEHFSFYCANSKRILMERAGFPHAHFIKTNIHGGSILGIFAKEAAPLKRAISGFDKESDFFISEINKTARPSEESAHSFAKRAQETCLSMKKVNTMAKASNMQVALVGAAAKAITFLQVANLDVDRVFDEAPLKVGRYILGTDLQIEALTNVSEITVPTLYIIGAWNFKDEIVTKLNDLRNCSHPGGDIYTCYFPRVGLF